MNLRIANFGFRISPPPSRSRRGGWDKFRIPNSEFRIRNCFLAAAAFLVALAPGLASAKLAVFVDGRVLKVADARLVGDEIVLDLKGGGTLRVPAVRIDRVIADEVEDTSGANGLDERDCPSSWTGAPLPPETPFGRSISAAARATDLHPWLVAAVVQTESAFDPRAVSRVGASGLMQLMPAAAADQEVIDVFNPSENLRGGTRHLRAMLDRFDSLSLALAAYNSGASTVERHGGIPPYKETRDYVRRVLDLFCPED